MSPGFRLRSAGDPCFIVSRYTPLIRVGEAEAWLAGRFKSSESGWTRTWTLALWVPARGLFLLGYRLIIVG